LLNLKVEKSLEVIKEALQKFYPKIAVVWSTSKDSTVMLFLVRKINPNVRVLFGDTTQHFKETYDFRDSIVKEWNLNLINLIPDVSYDEVKGERERCCHHLKTVPALKAIEELGLKAVLVGIRWGEHPSRANEDYFSKRENPPHYQVHPMLHWTEQEIWRFIKMYSIPYNPLYDKGYGSIECKPCTKIAPPGAPIRFRRAKDREEIMERLRKLGYW